MIRETTANHKRTNMLHTFLIFASMLGLMSLIGFMLAGASGILFAFGGGLVILLLGPRTSIKRVLVSLKAQPLSLEQYPQLHRIVRQMAERGKLSYIPRFYRIDSKIPNAFAIGASENASIVISDSLLRNLNLRELAGIIGHEMAHIRNNDLQVLMAVDVTRRIMHSMANIGQILVIISIPALLMKGVTMPLFPLLLLFLAPTAGMLLQLALSRTREFEADRVGAYLAGDVYGLASALKKLDSWQQSIWAKMVRFPWQRPAPAMLQTHPPTTQRIERLLGLVATPVSKRPPVKRVALLSG